LRKREYRLESSIYGWVRGTHQQKGCWDRRQWPFFSAREQNVLWLSCGDGQQAILSHTSHSDLWESIDQVSQRYFDGRPVLFNNRQEGLNRLIKGMEDIIDLHNRTLASHASDHHIGLEDIKPAIQPHVRAKATSCVDRAKAEPCFSSMIRMRQWRPWSRLSPLRRTFVAATTDW
jgi:hypothetical protein